MQALAIVVVWLGVLATVAMAVDLSVVYVTATNRAPARPGKEGVVAIDVFESDERTRAA